MKTVMSSRLVEMLNTSVTMLQEKKDSGFVVQNIKSILKNIM